MNYGQNMNLEKVVKELQSLEWPLRRIANALGQKFGKEILEEPEAHFVMSVLIEKISEYKKDLSKKNISKSTGRLIRQQIRNAEYCIKKLKLMTREGGD